MAAAKKGSPVDTFELLFRELAKDEEAVATVAKTRLRLLLKFTAPDGAVAVDGRARPFTVTRDQNGFAADLTLTMSCAIADRFFLGTLELMKAIAARDITSQGSIFRMLELRPVLDRARETYRQLR